MAIQMYLSGAHPALITQRVFQFMQLNLQGSHPV